MVWMILPELSDMVVLRRIGQPSIEELMRSVTSRFTAMSLLCVVKVSFLGCLLDDTSRGLRRWPGSPHFVDAPKFAMFSYGTVIQLF